MKLFAYSSILLALIYTSASRADESVQIKLVSYSKPISCLKDAKGAGFVCKGEGGRPVLVSSSNTGFGYTAISFNEKAPRLLKTHVVEEIKDNERVIFSAISGFPGAGSYGGFGGTGQKPSQSKVVQGELPGTGGASGYGGIGFSLPPPQTTDDSLMAVYGDHALVSLLGAKTIDQIEVPKASEQNTGYGSGVFGLVVRQKGGEEYERTFEVFKANYDDSRAKLKSALDKSDFLLELGDGQKISCTKGVNRKLGEDEKTRYEKFGAMPSCQIMKCGPAKWEGKNRDLALLVPYVAGSEGLTKPIALVTSDSEGVVDVLKVRVLRHSELRDPLISLNPEFERYFEELAKKSSQSPFASVFPPAPSKEDLSFLTHPMIKMSIASFKASCAPDDPVAAFFDKHYQALRTTISQKELIQVITEGSKVLRSSLQVAGSAARGCNDFPVVIDKSVSAHDSLKSFREKTNPRTISLDKAQELFEQARQMSDIAWDYKADGCYARAHLMARRFEALGVDVGKAWISGDLQVPSEQVSWNFHVAPVVYVESKKGDIERYVIDPSLAKGPVTVKQWSAMMAKGVIGPDTYTQFPFPQNAVSFERTAIAFSSAEPYLQYDQVDKSEELKMTEAIMTMKRYKQVTK